VGQGEVNSAIETALFAASWHKRHYYKAEAKRVGRDKKRGVRRGAAWITEEALCMMITIGQPMASNEFDDIVHLRSPKPRKPASKLDGLRDTRGHLWDSKGRVTTASYAVLQ
jgi:hypothetical protein